MIIYKAGFKLLRNDFGEMPHALNFYKKLYINKCTYFFTFGLMTKPAVFISFFIIYLFSALSSPGQNFLGYYRYTIPRIMAKQFKAMHATYQTTLTDSTMIFSIKDSLQPQILQLHFKHNRCNEVRLSTLCSPCMEFHFNNLKNYRHGKDWKKVSETKLLSKKAKIVAEVILPQQSCPYLRIYKYPGSRKQFKAERRYAGN